MRVKLMARLMVVALGATFVVAAPPGSGVAQAQANSTVGLGMETYADMIVDSAHGHLFFSPGRSGSGVRVTDLAGGSQQTLPDLPGAHGMALSPDGSTLYVALVDEGAIAAIDTATLAVTRRYSIGANTCPTWLAPAGGKLYFGHSCMYSKGKLGSLDVRGETPVVALDLPLDGEYYYPPLLRSSAANPDLLLLVNPSSVTFSISGRPILYNVSSGTPSKVASLPGDTCTGLHDAALAPDASKVILACSHFFDPDSGYRTVATDHVAFSTTDLSAAGVYPSAAYPVAATTSPDGSFVIVGSSDGSDWAKTSAIYVERPDGSLVHRYDLPQGTYLERRGLAVSADNSTLYAVTTDENGQDPNLRLLRDYAKTGSTLTLSAPSHSPGGAVAISGTLSFHGETLSSPQKLRVSRQDGTGIRALPDVTTAADGTFSLSDMPTYPWTNTYTVTYPGDATHAATSRSVAVSVWPVTSSLTLSAPATSTRAVKLTISGTLSFTGGTVSTPWTLRVVKKDLAGTHTLPTVTTTATGAFSFSDTPPVGGANTYTVTFSGDPAHQGSSRSATVQVSRAATALSVAADATTYSYGRTATVTAHLGTTYNNRTVCLYAQPYGYSRTTLKCGTVNSYGNLTATYPMYRRTTFSASFAGDYRYAPASASRAAYAYARVTGALSGYYATSGSYKVYRRTVNPVLQVAVAPTSPGVCVYYTVQAYYSGAWRTVSTSSCRVLDSASRGTYSYPGSRSTGIPYRVRARFAGTTANLATYGAWQYLKFTS